MPTPQSLSFQYLLLSWWLCLGKLRKCGLRSEKVCRWRPALKVQRLSSRLLCVCISRGKETAVGCEYGVKEAPSFLPLPPRVCFTIMDSNPLEPQAQTNPFSWKLPWYVYPNHRQVTKILFMEKLPSYAVPFNPPSLE